MTSLGNFLSGMETRIRELEVMLEDSLGNFLSGMETVGGRGRPAPKTPLETSLVEWKQMFLAVIDRNDIVPWKLP